MLERLINALVESPNQAADDVLLEALRLGNEREQAVALEALLRRETEHGLAGVVARFDALPERLGATVLREVKRFHHALRECGRSDDSDRRLAAMRLIALGRQGRLAYVLSENMHEQEEHLRNAATEAMVDLARWVATETRNLQRGAEPATESAPLLSPSETYAQLMHNRPEIEAAIARAMDVHRSRQGHGAELLRAALYLCDWPGSKTLAILHTTKHGGQSSMVRRLQQPPAAEHVEAFMLGASHGGLRSHFGAVFAHVEEAPVLGAVLRLTHWLKDHQLQLCVHQVSRGIWWDAQQLARDAEHRDSAEAAAIGEWLAASGAHDVMQDERMKVLLGRLADDFRGRLRLLRIAMRRKRGSSVELIKAFLTDPDERLVRMAAREILRRRPVDFENILLQLMAGAPESVRRVVGRSIGPIGFEHFWARFDHLDRASRRTAGRAMLKLLPDAAQRLSRRLMSGPVEQRLKAMQVAQDLDLADLMRTALVPLCAHPNARVRSKAVGLLGEMPSVPPEVAMDKLLNDADPRVRANAIEVLEAKRQDEFVPLLMARARSSHNRERANAIKALHRMKVGTAGTQLLNMMRDDRGEHRISALWALRQIGWWQLLGEVGRLAKEDSNFKVRRYALALLRGVAETAQAMESNSKAG